MKKATVPPVATPTNIMPDVLGLKHSNGVAITLESSLFWADEIGQQYREKSQRREQIRCNPGSDPVQAEELRELETWLTVLHAARQAWLSLANVFEALKAVGL